MDSSNSQKHWTYIQGDHDCFDTGKCEAQEAFVAEVFNHLSPVIDRITRPASAVGYMGRIETRMRLFEIGQVQNFGRIFVDEKGNWFLAPEVGSEDFYLIKVRDLYPHQLMGRVSATELINFCRNSLGLVITRRQDYLNSLVDRRDQLEALLQGAP